MPQTMLPSGVFTMRSGLSALSCGAPRKEECVGDRATPRRKTGNAFVEQSISFRAINIQVPQVDPVDVQPTTVAADRLAP